MLELDQGQWPDLAGQGWVDMSRVTYSHYRALVQPPSSLMRYMRHCHRREWLESLFDKIAVDKIPGIVQLLAQRFKHIASLLGTLGW